MSDRLLCPSCGRPLYSRAHPSCGWCQAPLPAEYIMNNKAAAWMRNEMRAIEERRKAAQAEEDREAPWRGTW